jgi:hypothetical protein
MTVSHTPTPWAVEKNSVNAENGSVVSIAECGFSVPGQSWSGTDYSTKEHQAANADFIVRACNSHDLLVAALADALELLENHQNSAYCQAFRNSDEAVLDAARAALAASGAA